MKLKTLAVLAVILGILTGIGLLMLRAKAPEADGGRLGAPLLARLPVNEVAAITLQGPGERVSLTRLEDGWVVKERSDYPADFSKIANLVKELKAAKIGRAFEASRETMKRLTLLEPDDPEAMPNQKGTRLRLVDDKGRPLADVLLGNTRKPEDERARPDSRYVRLDENETVYLVDAHFAGFDAYAAAWLDNTVVNVPANQVRKIACLSDKGANRDYALARGREDENFKLSGPAVGRPLTTAVVDKLAGALASLRLEDVAPMNLVSKSAPAERPVLEYSLFDGMRYRIYPGPGCQASGKCILRIEVKYSEDVGGDETSGPDDEKTSDRKKGAETRAREAKELNARLIPWLFTVPKWQHDAFVTDADKLVGK
ncbi:MAG: DUF4340 domain-containing protein [Deltaproteobacteria bacterium]|nr:DUF4340 domain-containing protein [Deltaproteobacteria bacterium]